MIIARPRHEPNQEDYALDCHKALDLPLAGLVDQAIQAGWEPRQVFKALQVVVEMQALAYEEDPDPAGD